MLSELLRAPRLAACAGKHSSLEAAHRVMSREHESARYSAAQMGDELHEVSGREVQALGAARAAGPSTQRMPVRCNNARAATATRRSRSGAEVPVEG